MPSLIHSGKSGKKKCTCEARMESTTNDKEKRKQWQQMKEIMITEKYKSESYLNIKTKNGHEKQRMMQSGFTHCNCPKIT